VTRLLIKVRINLEVFRHKLQKVNQKTAYTLAYMLKSVYNTVINQKLEMWANAQRDGRPAKYRWRPVFNRAPPIYGWRGRATDRALDFAINRSRVQ